VLAVPIGDCEFENSGSRDAFNVGNAVDHGTMRLGACLLSVSFSQLRGGCVAQLVERRGSNRKAAKP